MRKHILIAMGMATMIFGSVVLAEPTTRPTASTQPAASDLYLIPFTALGKDASLDWAGKAVQQNLLTDLARAKVKVIPADGPIEKTADAQAAARAAGAKYILTGTYQVADTLLRFNGQVIETASGNVVGGISATGVPRDLFSMEDTLSAQAIGQLVHLPMAMLANKPPAIPAPPPPTIAQAMQQPQLSLAQPGSTSSYTGSTLQQYVEANRTPSTDFNQQVQDASDRYTNDYGYNLNYIGASPYYGGGFGYGIGYGGYGVGYGGYGLGYGGSIAYSVSYGSIRSGHTGGFGHHGGTDRH